MALRNILPFSPGSASGGGNSVGRPSTPQLRDRRSAWTDDEPLWRYKAGSLRTAAREIRDTAAAVMCIGRFVIFIAALLAKHHLRRLSPAAPMSDAQALATTLGRPVVVSRRRAVVRCRG